MRFWDAGILVVVLQPSRGGRFGKSLIINTRPLGHPRSMLPGRQTERLLQKISTENQVFT